MVTEDDLAIPTKKINKCIIDVEYIMLLVEIVFPYLYSLIHWYQVLVLAVSEIDMSNNC